VLAAAVKSGVVAMLPPEDLWGLGHRWKNDQRGPTGRSFNVTVAGVRERQFPTNFTNQKNDVRG